MHHHHQLAINDTVKIEVGDVRVRLVVNRAHPSDGLPYVTIRIGHVDSNKHACYIYPWWDTDEEARQGEMGDGVFVMMKKLGLGENNP